MLCPSHRVLGLARLGPAAPQQRILQRRAGRGMGLAGAAGAREVLRSVRSIRADPRKRPTTQRISIRKKTASIFVWVDFKGIGTLPKRKVHFQGPKDGIRCFVGVG